LTRWIAASVAAVVLSGIGAAAYLWSSAAVLPVIDPDDPAQVALGERLYVAQCARCHGAALEGQPNWRERLPNGRLPAPPHDATGHTSHHSDAVLFGLTKDGLGPYAPAGYRSDMPAFRDLLGDEDIAAVLAFIKSRWPPEIRRRQTSITERAD